MRETGQLKRCLFTWAFGVGVAATVDLDVLAVDVCHSSEGAEGAGGWQLLLSAAVGVAVLGGCCDGLALLWLLSLAAAAVVMEWCDPVLAVGLLSCCCCFTPFR